MSREQVWNTVDVEYGTYNWLRREVSRKIGYQADHHLLGRTERAHVDSVIDSAIQQFAIASWASVPRSADPSAGEGRNEEGQHVEADKEVKRRPPHRWSFLLKFETITTVIGTSNYALPNDFSGWIGEPTSSRTGGRIGIARESHIRQLQASEPQSGKPTYCTIRKTSIGGQTRQASELVLYPTPDAIETITVEYSVNPETLDDQNQYPPGGLEHAETVLAYCFYVHAQREGKEIQEAALFLQDRLAASIEVDKQSAKPTTDGVWVDDDGKFNAAWLSRMVGRHIGAGPNPSAWTHQQEQLIAEAIRRARRRVYNPPLVFNEKIPHDWSFLRPLATLLTVAGQHTYDMPADYVQLYGPMTHDPDDASLYPPIIYTGEDDIRQLLQLMNTSTRPTKVAIRPKEFNVSEGTRYEAIFWPIPDAQYRIHFRYRVNPDTSGTNSLPALVANLDLHGGDRFSEMYLEAALLSADNLMEVKRSPHEERFYLAVQSAIGQDRKTNTPDTVGYNGDPSSSRRRSYDDVHDWDLNIVTYNGNTYF